jgi:hypothetical protein
MHGITNEDSFVAKLGQVNWSLYNVMQSANSTVHKQTTWQSSMVELVGHAHVELKVGGLKHHDKYFSL